MIVVVVMIMVIMMVVVLLLSIVSGIERKGVQQRLAVSASLHSN